MKLDVSDSVLNLTQGQFFHFSEPKYRAQITKINKPTIYTVLGKLATAFTGSVLSLQCSDQAGSFLWSQI
jgi:hypothetical protein